MKRKIPTVKDAIAAAREGTTSVWIAIDGESEGTETDINSYDKGFDGWKVVRQWYEPFECLSLIIKRR